MSWTEADVPAQHDRTVVVTGANSGIGYETARVLAERGATVIMACRSTDRGREAAKRVQSTDVPGTLVVAGLDLADLESVRTFPDRLADASIGGASVPTIDCLINNAGVMAIPRSETADGFETQFGVNHLGHFALTGVLLGHLAADARVVTVSSKAHEGGEIDFADLNHEDAYDKWGAYAQSKLANLLFAYELDRRLEAAEMDVTSVACHPGYADTNLQARGPKAAGSKLRLAAMGAINAIVAQSAADGALPTLYAATHPEVEGGAYYGPGGLFGMRGAPERQESTERSHDRETARALWTVSEELTGVEIEIPPRTEGWSVPGLGALRR
ncbi:oxidoreductase [Saliphagus sp. LR7]|uniref:oxidoreductase n=1 Tax=Saliphagus sp. LR7 TaxID=2282654 RepID=UPI000DF83C98|nr:oxidoreductase [Saliphagus sp. LR7]